MGRLRTDHAMEMSSAMNRYLQSPQHFRIHSPHAGEAEKPILVNARDHEADLVVMGSDQNIAGIFPLTFFQPDHIKKGIHLHFITIIRQDIRNGFNSRIFPSSYGIYTAKLSYKLATFHEIHLDSALLSAYGQFSSQVHGIPKYYPHNIGL